MIDFPNTPTLNQTFSAAGKSWRWNGAVWTAHSADSSAPRFWAFAESGSSLYLGSILISDIGSGSVYDAPLWDITRTTTNSSGEVTGEASASGGAWSNRASLTYA